MMKNKKLLYGILGGIIIVLILGIVIFNMYESNNSITLNVDKMVDRAEQFYKEGKIEDALYQMQMYCDQKSDNFDGYLLLGDWYMELGDTDEAYSYYKNASENYDKSENELSEVIKITSVNEASDKLSLKIKPIARLTKNMILTVSGENLTPEKNYPGKIEGSSKQLLSDENYITTDWFNIDDKQKNILLTGDMNCAIWQFADKNDNITYINDKSDFRLTSNVDLSNKSFSSVEIPVGSVKARVTYKDKIAKFMPASDNKILITYGSFLEGYTNTETVTYKIPDMEEGQYIIYEDDKWSFFDGKETKSLDWKKIKAPKNSFYSISGDLCGAVEFSIKESSDNKVNKSLEYGIRYSTKSGVASCERIGASKGMKFNYTIGDKWAESGDNDFDNAYPWCDMKLCNVKYDDYGEKEVTYSDSKKFKKDGSNGNVMVEIPKFYIKRTVKNDNEEIWISGKQHKNYQVDPIFIDEYGNELDYVYIAAYLGSEKDNKIVSAANTYPTLMLTYGDTIRMAENNGGGYSELNYLMCSALQKLFIVETGTIDSSSVFSGETSMYYYSDTDSKAVNLGLAAKDQKNSNIITLHNNYGTQKLAVGSSIALFDEWDNYDNNETQKREILNIKTSEKYIEVEFDGKPIDIEKGKTHISNVPSLTGKTDKIAYCTGILEGEDGKVSFKYRNIENIYGSALVMLDDDAYIEGGYFYYYDAKYIFHMVDTPVAEQSKDLENNKDVNLKCCIAKMTYDEDNPSIMLPSNVGGKASAHNYYGDFWMYKKTEDGEKRYLAFGGANDNAKLAGIFHMRATILDDDFSNSAYSARIMCK